MQKNYKESKKLKEIESVRHGFFTKKGGVSSGIYDSLNCAPNSDDRAENVLENRKRVLHALNLEKGRLFGLHQIHSTIVHPVDSETNIDFPDGDALVTKDKGVALSVLGADCTPVLFSDINGSVIGAAHAGWKGAVTGIVEAVVLKMCELGAQRENIIAGIGPTIHPSSYEVQQDFIRQINELSSFSSDNYLLEDQGRYYFDLPGYLLEQCQRSGIQSENLGLDTYVLKDDFFSYRRNTHEGIKDYGRQISVICRL